MKIFFITLGAMLTVVFLMAVGVIFNKKVLNLNILSKSNAGWKSKIWIKVNTTPITMLPLC